MELAAIPINSESEEDRSAEEEKATENPIVSFDI
jgi:hypothetical protein